MVLKSLSLLWIQWLAIAIFLYGFLPIKEPRPGLAEPQDILPREIQSEWMTRKVGQVVLVVIDALRADFVLEHERLQGSEKRPKIEFLHELIANGDQNVKAFVARANAPTVTMPRIKALMSGSIPGFIDVVLNFGSSQMQGDNLVEQWRKAGLQMTMFGDDTWLNLFPSHFLRWDGTTSFFVSDYSEVDDNVTRHLEWELKSKDWDVCILHYLGLDHIGHLIGPQGSPVVPKLAEMGQIIKLLKHSLLDNKEAWKENLPPLIVVLGDHGMADAGGHGGSTDSEILTPMVFLSTLRLTPKEFLVKQTDLVPTLAWLTGVPIPKNNLGSLMFTEPGSLAHSYVQNQIKDALGKDFETVEEYEANFTQFDVKLMVAGICLAQLSSFWSFDPLFLTREINWLRLMHILSLFSTSFIEEEHQGIYLFAMTILTFLLIHAKGKEQVFLLLAMGCLRFARTLNQTGDKWRHIPGYNELLRQEGNERFLLTSVILSTMTIAVWQKGFSSCLYILVLLQKISDLHSKRLVWPAQIIYVTSLLSFGKALLQRDKQDLCRSILPVMAVISPPQNMILLAVHLCLEKVVSRQKVINDQLMLYGFMGWALFFHMGNSNGLASIDIGSAYVGISFFNPWLVGSLLAVSTFSGIILWTVLAFSNSHLRYEESSFVFFRGVEITIYLATVTSLRQHLFVWTVFSPKLLYLAMAVTVVNILHTIFLIFGLNKDS